MGAGDLGSMAPPSQPTGRALYASVLIPTFNRREFLLQTLKSLEGQTLAVDRYEVVVSIDGSNDDTVEALKRFTPSYPFRWVYQRNQGVAAASNAAARQARHDVLLFLDDDQIASPDLIAVHLEVQQRQGPALIQGFYPLAPGYNRRGASLIYERSMVRSLSPVDAQHPLNSGIWSANISVPRELWERVGGFDESFRDYGGEDTDFGMRVAALGVPVVFEPRAFSYHLHSVSYSAARHQAFSGGKSLVQLARKHSMPISSFSGGSVERGVNQRVGAAWRRAPRVMELLGRMLTVSLWAADAVGVRRLQLGTARLLHRYYKVGGIVLESARTQAPEGDGAT